MFPYFAYGLNINSEFPIPEFVHSDFNSFDTLIRSASPLDNQVEFSRENPYFYSGEDCTSLKIPSIGLFSIRQGREISVSLEGGVDLNRLHLFLSGNILAFLLLQRGYFVLHASAACIGGQAAAFLGMPGSGKSSLAAALHQLGHTILVDDVTAVDLNASPPSVLPAFPQIKLDIATAKSLGIDPETLIPLDASEEKRGFRFAGRFPEANQTLSKIYILTERGDQVFERLAPQEAIVELVRNSYPTRFAQAGGASHFLQCVDLVKHVPVFRLKRPIALDGLLDFAALLANHISSDPS